MSNRIQWDSRDAEKAAGYRRKGYTFGKIAELMHFSIDQAKRMVEFIDPDLVEKVPQQEPQAQFGGYGVEGGEKLAWNRSKRKLRQA